MATDSATQVLDYFFSEDEINLELLKEAEISPFLFAQILFKTCGRTCSYNITNDLVKVARDKLFDYSVTQILEHFDSPYFNKQFLQLTHFNFNEFFNSIVALAISYDQEYSFGIIFFHKAWIHNSIFQLKFIKFCIDNNHVSTVLNNCKSASIQLNKYVTYIESLKSLAESNIDIVVEQWKFKCLYRVLIELSNFPSLHFLLEMIFNIPLCKCPDLFVLGLLDCAAILSKLKDLFMVKAILKFLYPASGHLNATQIFQKLWPSDYQTQGSLSWSQEILLKAMVELYNTSSLEDQQQKLSRILDLSQDLKALNYLLANQSHLFVIDLACLASRREYLKLDKWLNDKIASIGKPFIEACVIFVKRRYSFSNNGETSRQKVFIPSDTLNVIFCCLQNYLNSLNYSNLTTPLDKELLNMVIAYQNDSSNNSFPNLSNVNFTSLPSQLKIQKSNYITDFSANALINFSQDVEEETDLFFKKMFSQDESQHMTVTEVLESLKRFHNSQNKKENEVVICVINNLFKEMPFLSNYNEKELTILGELFGGMIDLGLVNNVSFLFTLRFILEALKKPSNSKPFKFAIIVLDQFKSKIKEFPGFCINLYNLPNFADLPQHLANYIDYGRSNMAPSLPNVPLNITQNGSIKECELKREEINEQLSQLEEKLNFMFNNLDYVKMKNFANQIRDLLENNHYYQSMSEYFTRRAIKESNHHKLFSDFLDLINVSQLYSSIIDQTYCEIKILLQIIQNDSNKKKLCSAGQWLGFLTLRRNKPVLTIKLDLRNLIVEAYHKGTDQILYVVPFVTKVLSSCSSSIFKPPNPWTNSLISILAELYTEFDSTLKLKFEVEVLCRNLEININDYIGNSEILKNKDIFKQVDALLPHKASLNRSDRINNTLSNGSISHTDAIAVQQNSIDHDASNVANSSDNTLNSTSFNQSIIIQPKLQLIVMLPALKNVIKSLIEKNVYDFTNTLYEKIYKICTESVGCIVKKDFSLDPNPKIFISYSEKMLRYLVSNYVMIHTKEPLMSRIQATLQALLSNNCLNVSKEIIDSTALTIVHDNIDICLYYVQNNCIEKCLEELEKKIQHDIELRKQALAEGKLYYDPVAYAFQNERMPEPIRIKCGPTPIKKLVVYEEMAQNISLLSNSPQMFIGQVPNKTIPQVNNIGHNIPNSVFSSATASHTPQVTDALALIYDRLIKHLAELLNEFQALNLNPEAMYNVLDILKHTKKSPRDENLVLNLIKHIVSGLRELLVIKKDSSDYFPLITRARDFYLLLLKAMTDQRAYNLLFITNQITRCVMEYWFRNDVTFPDDLFDIFSQASFINYSTLDTEFVHILENTANISFIRVIMNFLKCYLSNGISVNIFVNTLECFRKFSIGLKPSNHLFVEMKTLFEMCHISYGMTPNTETSPVVGTLLIDKVNMLFKEWLTCFHNSNNYQMFVKNLDKQGFLKSEDTMLRFFKETYEICIDVCYQIFNLPQSQNNIYDLHHKCFVYLDAFSYLVIFIVKIKNNIEFKMHLLNRILTIVSSLAKKHQETKQRDFFYLPYYRILVVLFLEFTNNYTIYSFAEFNTQFKMFFLENVKAPLVSNFCTHLNLMSPSNVPSFIFAWLEFISHRSFIGKCLDDGLNKSNCKLWQNYFVLLNDLLIFQKPFIQNINIPNSLKFLFKGTLKLFLLLLHDFPEFLCEYCYLICDIIPHSAYQIRNIVLSAFPSDMRLPDPFLPNLKLEGLKDILQNYKGIINSSSFERFPLKKDLDIYLKTRSSFLFLNELNQLFNSNNVKLQEQLNYINLIIFYIGDNVIQNCKVFDMVSIENEPSMLIIRSLAECLDTERRYFLLNSMANHLRYPNIETLYFICSLLHLFKESDVLVKEQIVRVLLERLVVFKPHPWGLLFIVNELSKNAIYNFWNYDFIKFEPKIIKILNNLGIQTSK